MRAFLVCQSTLGDIGGKESAIPRGLLRLSQLVARAERGERIVIARDGKPVAIDGAGGNLSNADLDRLLYGKS